MQDILRKSGFLLILHTTMWKSAYFFIIFHSLHKNTKNLFRLRTHSKTFCRRLMYKKQSVPKGLNPLSYGDSSTSLRRIYEMKMVARKPVTIFIWVVIPTTNVEVMITMLRLRWKLNAFMERQILSSNSDIANFILASLKATRSST